ncbi:hypothetical protein ABH20_18140 [Geobacillus sp. T6]|nr:hypothetical protein GT3921_15805 [Geobacillus thermocatenulatus]KLR72109.1 hypothetical protein ABH20_18140 [Geobacillus sp. T6]
MSPFLFGCKFMLVNLLNYSLILIYVKIMFNNQILLYPYTNARIEGTNHKIKNIKCRTYGYRNLERFRLRVFLECTGNTTGSQAA